MATQPCTSVCGSGTSNGTDVVIANIGPSGNVFTGTFIGRSSVYAWDFITSMYTDKEGVLYVAFIAGDVNLDVHRTSPHSWALNFTNYLATFTYDPKTGNFNINAPAGHWVQGALMGTYTAVP